MKSITFFFFNTEYAAREHQAFSYGGRGEMSAMPHTKMPSLLRGGRGMDGVASKFSPCTPIKFFLAPVLHNSDIKIKLHVTENDHMTRSITL